MTTTTFDRLTYVDKLKAAGVDDTTARAHADALEQALREEVATKRDIVELKHLVEVGLRDVTIRLGSMIIVATGVLLAAKYFG